MIDPNDPYVQAFAPSAPSTDQTPTTQPTEETHKPTRSRDEIAAKAQTDAEGGDEAPTGFGGYAWDAAKGVAAGGMGFIDSIGKLGNDIAGAFGHKFTDDSTFDNPIHTHTWAGSLTSGLTQFALGFLPALGVAGKIGSAIGVTSKLAQGLAAGAAADFIGFSDKQQKLSDLVQSVPALKNPITDFLSSKTDDNFAEGRLKNALEGLGMGLIMHPVMESLKGFKGMMLAKAAGDPEAYSKAASATADKVAEAMKSVNESAPAANASANAVATATGDANLSGTAGAIGKASLKNVPDDLVNKMVDHITTSDKPFDVAVDESVQAHLNFDRITTTDDVKGLEKLALNISEKYFQTATGGKMGLGVVEDTANQLAEIYGESPKLLFASSGADAKAIKDVGVRLVAYRIQRNAIGQSLVNAADQFLGSGKGDDDLFKRITNLARAFQDVHNNVQVIQKEGARIPSFGRVDAATSVFNYDPDKLAQTVANVMNGGQGKLAREQLVRTIVATQADPKSVMTLFDGVMKQAGGKATSVLNELHVNSILSSLATPAKKLISDLGNAFMLPAERVMGGAWQQNAAMMKSGFRMFSNVITSALDWTHLSEAAGNISDKYGSSIGRAVQAGLSEQPLLDHLSEHNPTQAITAANLGMSSDSMMGSAVNYLGKVVRLPQRILIGMDQFWKDVNFRSYVRDEAWRMAEDRGLTPGTAEFGQAMDDHITQSFTGDGRSSNDAAFSYAKAATFQNDLLPKTLGNSVANAVNQHPALKLIMPFVKTPTNIFRRAWQMTPGLNMLQGEFRQMMGSADPIVRAQAQGRMTLGGTLWTLGVGMAASGRLTGGGPSKFAEKNSLMDSGWQPYSLVTTGPDGKQQYISYKALEPFSTFLSLAADWKDAVGQAPDDDAEKTGMGMVYALAKNLSSKTYMTGLVQLINALAAPDQQIQRYMNSMASSFVPQALGKADTDDYMREASGMLDAMKRKIPGLSDTLPPNRNILGEPMQTPAGYLPFGASGSWLARQVSPFAYSQQVSDPTKDELAKLQYGFSKAPQRVQGMDLTMFRNKDGQDAYDRFQELHGQVKIGSKSLGDSLNDLISSKRYQSMPTPDRHSDDTNRRVMAVQSVIAAYRGRALAQTLQEYPQVGNALKAYQAQSRTQSPTLAALAQR